MKRTLFQRIATRLRGLERLFRGRGKYPIRRQAAYPVGQWSRWYQANKRHQKSLRYLPVGTPRSLRREWVR